MAPRWCLFNVIKWMNERWCNGCINFLLLTADPEVTGSGAGACKNMMSWNVGKIKIII